jgi:TctA family transporter
MRRSSVMKNLPTFIRFSMCAWFLIGHATSAWAAAAGREDNSDLFVWIFLSFCALIVVAQLIPAMMLFMGFAKGARKGIREAVPARIKD